MARKPGTVEIIGVPLDLGQDQRGVDLGPGALRYARIAEHLAQLGYAILDRGNSPVPVRDMLAAERSLHYLPSIHQVCEQVYRAAEAAVEAGHLPLFLGGDHALAIGSVGGVSSERPVGLLWIDAHGDFNTPQTTQSGNIHGMPLAVLLGDGYPELVNLGRRGAKLDPRDVVLLGVRELDPGERERLRASGITIFTMRDIDERGIDAVTREALARLAHRDRLHVSLDLDVLDALHAPGVGTPSPGGLTYREAQLVMELVAECGRLSSVDLVEINPILDHRNRTATIAVELVASLFGKQIL